MEQVHLCVDITRNGDAITGTVTVGADQVRKFNGRLGLFSTIDDEIERIAPDRRQPHEVQPQDVQPPELQSHDLQEESEDDDK